MKFDNVALFQRSEDAKKKFVDDFQEHQDSK
jgi:hypothetical protein